MKNRPIKNPDLASFTKLSTCLEPDPETTRFPFLQLCLEEWPEEPCSQHPYRPQPTQEKSPCSS